MRFTTTSILLGLAVHGLASPAVMDIPRGLSHREIVKRMAALPAPDPALYPDERQLTERELDELDWSVWESRSVDEEDVPDPENPHEFDPVPDGMEWSGDEPEPQWSIDEGSDDGLSQEDIELCNEAENCELADGPDGLEVKFVEGKELLSQWWNTTVHPHLSEEDLREEEGEGEDFDDEEMNSAVRDIDWTPNPHVRRANCPGKDKCTIVTMKKKRNDYGEIKPKQVQKKLVSTCGSNGCNNNFNMGTRFWGAGTIKAGSLNVKTTGQWLPGQKGRFMKLMNKVLTSKTKIVHNASSVCNNFICPGLKTYRATRKVNINRWVRGSNGLALKGFYSATMDLQAKGGIGCKVAIDAAAAGVGSIPGGGPVAAFFGFFKYVC